MLLFATVWIILAAKVERERPRVTVDWTDSTDLEGNARRVFVISNSGPGAVEWDLGHYQWADLNASDSVSGAFVMGGSGRLASGEADSLAFFRPTRPEGTWRFAVPCRRAEGVVARLHARSQLLRSVTGRITVAWDGLDGIGWPTWWKPALSNMATRSAGSGLARGRARD